MCDQLPLLRWGIYLLALNLVLVYNIRVVALVSRVAKGDDCKSSASASQVRVLPTAQKVSSVVSFGCS